MLKRDYDQRLDSLTAQLMMSEDVLGTKDSQIQDLQQRVKDYDGLKNQLAMQQQEIVALQEQVSELICSLCIICKGSSRLCVSRHLVLSSQNCPD